MEQAKAKVEAFRIERGYLPKVLALEGEGIVAVEESVKSALNVLEVFENILKISFYSENFGGPKFSSHPLWMDLIFSTPVCGEKTAPLLSSFQVIHIIFYYDSCYYK